MVAVAGVTVTLATGSTGVVTVIEAVPVFPPLVAEIVTEPAATAVTRPVLDTVATLVFDELQVMVRPVSGLPLASLGVAVSWAVWPTVRLDDVGETETEATGTRVTVIAAVPVFPSLVAEIVAEPA